MRKTSFFFPATRLISRLEAKGYRTEGPYSVLGGFQFIGVFDKDDTRVATASRKHVFGELSIYFKYDDRPDIREAAKGLAIVY